MKKILAVGLMAMMIGMFIMPVNAADTQDLYITLNNNATASILLNDTSWEPTAGIDSSEQCANTTFELDNDGSVQVDVTVSAETNMTWTLESEAGHDQLQLGILPEDLAEITLDETATSFVSNLEHDQWQNFGFNLTMPVSTSTSAPAQINVTFTATAD